MEERAFENSREPNLTNNYYSTQNVYQQSLKSKRDFTRQDKYFSVLALLLGFVVIKVVTNSFDSCGFMTSVMWIGLACFNYFYSRKSGLNGSKENKRLFFVILVLSLLFVVTDNDYVKFINFWVVLLSNLYFVYSSYKSNNNSIIFNVFKSVVSSPFYQYGSLFEALLHKTEIKTEVQKKNQKDVMPTVIGFLLSIPVCIVVSVLLVESDHNFGQSFENFLNFISEYLGTLFENIFSNLMLFCFSIPISMYIFSAVYSRAYKMRNEKQLPKTAQASYRVLPSTMCNSFLTPLTLIYTAFVIKQVSYLFTTAGSLSTNFNYSEYARSGFFELCFVALINLSVIGVIMFFVQVRKKELPKSVRMFVVIFSFLTLCLIVTAIVKMAMYIDIYGMTPLRVYTSVFMIYLFLMFIVLIIKQFKFTISFTKTGYWLAVFVICAMSILPVDAYIARYNINAYVEGKIGWMGHVLMMYDLDSSSAEVFADYKPNEISKVVTYGQNSFTKTYPIKDYFNNKYIDDLDIYNFNFTRYRSLLTLQKYKSDNKTALMSED